MTEFLDAWEFILLSVVFWGRWMNFNAAVAEKWRLSDPSALC